MITVSASLFQSNSSTSMLFGMPSQAKVASAQGEENSQSGNFVLNHALKESVGVEMTRPVVPVAEAFDVDAVVDSVMQHVQDSIDQAAMSGASDEKLQSMMDAAREGVAKGFGQAREQLDELGKMDDALGAKITEAEDGIYAGMDDLEVALFGEPQDMDVEDASEVSGSVFEMTAQSYRQKSSFAFEVMTQEGDRVQISAFQAAGERSVSMMGGNDQNMLSMEAYSSFEASGYSLQVEGDLNEAELSALEDLFSQVNELSESFYSGDVETAFNMAMELTSDADQIAQFSLNLKQVETASYQYAGYGQQGGQEGGGLPRGLAHPLQQHAGGLQEVIDNAQAFQNPFELVQGLLDNFDASGKMQMFNDALFGAMDA